MANNTNYSAKQLTGYNIYHLHDKNQTIYYDNYTKTAYIITNQYVSSFSTWQMRLPLSIMFGALLVLIRINPWLSIALGIAAYVISTILFHTKYLVKLPVKTNFVKPASKGFFRELAARYPKNILTIIMIMFISMGIVMIINLIVNKYIGYAKSLTILFIIISFVAAGIIGYVIYLKNKENL